MTDVKIKKAVIREDLLSITNDYRKAIILNQFIYWSERVSDADKFIKKENEIAKNNGEEERELFYGWIYKTAEELADEVMLGLSASQIRRYISELVDMGYISKRNNPKYKWDRTLQYRVLNGGIDMAKGVKTRNIDSFREGLMEYAYGRCSQAEAAKIAGMSVPTFKKYANMHFLGIPFPDTLFKAKEK